MIVPKPLKFPIIPKASDIKTKRLPGRKRMTIIAGFCGFGGTILCADSQETVSGYAKRDVWKIHDLEVGDPPFHIAIAGSGEHGPYIDMLTKEIGNSFGRLDSSALKLSLFEAALSGILIQFYKQHVWPRDSQAFKLEFLVVIQPPGSEGYLFHVYETAINWIQDRKAIGVGSYLADVVLDNTLTHHGDEFHLVAVAVNVLKEVRDNISDCGKDPHVILYKKDGSNISLWPDQIDAIETMLGKFKNLVKGEFFSVTALRYHKHGDANPEKSYGHTSDEHLKESMEELRNEFWDIVRGGKFREENIA